MIELGDPVSPIHTPPHLRNRRSHQAGTTDRFLSDLLVNAEAKAVTNEAICVVARGQVDAVATVAMTLVPASLDDVRVDVEVGKQSQHYEHVSCQQVLAPARELALCVDAVERVRQRDEKLYLYRFGNRRWTGKCNGAILHTRTEVK